MTVDFELETSMWFLVNFTGEAKNNLFTITAAIFGKKKYFGTLEQYI